MNKTIKLLSFCIISGIIVAAVLLLLFVLGAIEAADLQNGIGKTLAVVGIVLGAGVSIMAVTRLTDRK